MPALMAAADALVENAGGLTVHGGVRGRPARDHVPADRRARQGQRRDDGELRRQPLRATTTHELHDDPARGHRARGPQRDEMIAAGRALFAGDPADDVDRARGRGQPRDRRVASSRSRRRRAARRDRRRRRRSLVLYVGLTVGAQARRGARRRRGEAAEGRRRTVYVGVRLDGRAAARPARAPRAVDDARTSRSSSTAARAGHAGARLERSPTRASTSRTADGARARTLRWNRATTTRQGVAR